MLDPAKLNAITADKPPNHRCAQPMANLVFWTSHRTIAPVRSISSPYYELSPKTAPEGVVPANPDAWPTAKRLAERDANRAPSSGLGQFHRSVGVGRPVKAPYGGERGRAGSLVRGEISLMAQSLERTRATIAFRRP